MKKPYFKTCPSCGAHLDPGELCDCNGLMPVPKDGCVAICPFFMARWDVGNHFEIQCRCNDMGVRYTFSLSEMRDVAYEVNCCHNYTQCEYYQLLQSVGRGDDEEKCRVCGCTWNNACPSGCWWVAPGLCSICVGKEEASQ